MTGIDATRRALTALAMTRSREAKRALLIPEILTNILDHLSKDDPASAAKAILVSRMWFDCGIISLWRCADHTILHSIPVRDSSRRQRYASCVRNMTVNATPDNFPQYGGSAESASGEEPLDFSQLHTLDFRYSTRVGNSNAGRATVPNISERSLVRRYLVPSLKSFSTQGLYRAGNYNLPTRLAAYCPNLEIFIFKNGLDIYLSFWWRIFVERCRDNEDFVAAVNLPALKNLPKLRHVEIDGLFEGGATALLRSLMALPDLKTLIMGMEGYRCIQGSAAPRGPVAVSCYVGPRGQPKPFPSLASFTLGPICPRGARDLLSYLPSTLTSLELELENRQPDLQLAWLDEVLEAIVAFQDLRRLNLTFIHPRPIPRHGLLGLCRLKKLRYFGFDFGTGFTQQIWPDDYNVWRVPSITTELRDAFPAECDLVWNLWGTKTLITE
ncbi:hypothetical protein B0H63DRAFT_475014 [Podospora didyma]|uniref:F-box domain-containing protein n=1 Tax=Podospora didyma TaxID=330526 RepID=A0AAE0NGN2_9PEZI|nr:hypothetical protein B0H63DRAFT_475014 [Podospora didyma]